MPIITEWSLVAVNTESILDLNAMLLSHLQNSKIKVEKMLPRVMTVCVYPMATIQPDDYASKNHYPTINENFNGY